MSNHKRLKEAEAIAVAKMRGVDVSTFNRGGSLSTYRVHLSPAEVRMVEAMRNGGEVEVALGIRRLFFDIETSPMLVWSWRIGRKISINYENIHKDWAIICISYKWEHEDAVHNLSWDNGDEREMLKEFIKIANTADEIIGHNSDRFDIKKVRTRCIKHRIPMFPKYRTFDTLKKARGSFSFNSNKLDDIGDYLDIGRKVEHEGFPLWLKCVAGDEDALRRMVEYCNGDVVLLEDTFHVLQHYVKPNTHVGVHHGLPKYSCPICGSEEISFVKTDVTQKGTISRVVSCNKCSHVYNISNKSYQDFLTKELT